MSSRLRIATLVPPVLLAAANLAGWAAGAAGSGRGVVWLHVETKGDSERVRLRAPLEWLASIDDDGALQKHATVEGIAIDPTALWKAHRDLPLGQALELQHGVTSEGDPYALWVRCDSVSADAQGRLHILTQDENGKVSDVRFPLDLPALFAHLLSPLGFHLRQEDDVADIRMPARDDLLRLGSYGTFTLLEVWKPDQQVRIAID